MISQLHYISQGETPQEHLQHITNACKNGAELVQLRLKNQTEDVVAATAQQARAITKEYGTQLIINDYYKVAKFIHADGVHLGKTDTCPIIAREYLGNDFIIGGTANTIDDCRALINKKVDYIGLGPFRFTTTKKKLDPVLGLIGYQTIIQELATQTPILAIGGITLNDVEAILQTGVHGIAASGLITKDFTIIPKLYEQLKGQTK